jgi:hypothetical protein
MRTVFPNRQLCHIWAQQTQPHGHSASMSFRGARLYSYSTVIAEIVDVSTAVSVMAGGERKVALLTSRTYSVTTSGKHMPAAYSAVANLRSFYVPMLDHAGNLKYLEATYRERAAKLMRVRELGSWQRENIVDIERDVVDYARIFGLPIPNVDAIADYGKATDRMERLANDPKRVAKRAAKRAAREQAKVAREAQEAIARVARDVERLAEWRVGGGTGWSYLKDEKGGAYLRVYNSLHGSDIVQTSLGAEVPAEDARRAIRFIRSIFGMPQGWQSNGDKLTVGAFQVNSIDSNGDIKAGCHFIQWSEIDAIGRQLGV